MVHDRVLAFLFCEGKVPPRKNRRRIQNPSTQWLVAPGPSVWIARRLAHRPNFAHWWFSGSMWGSSRKPVT